MSHHMMSHDESHDKCGKVVHRPCSSCISSVEKSNGNFIEFFLSIAEQRAVGFILAWSLATLHFSKLPRTYLLLISIFFHFCSHPGDTLTDFRNRLHLLNKPVGNKDKAAQLCCNQLRKLQANRSYMIVYTDRLQKYTHHYFQRVGSAVVGFIRH